MNLPQTHQSLFTKTSLLANELKGIEANVKQQEQALFGKIDQLSKRLTQASKQKQPATIKAALAANFTQAGALLSAWKDKVAHHETNLTFREKFGDSLLVYVYGKVKAGKSSLGNYLVTGAPEPSQELIKQLAKAGHAPQYFLHDQNQSFGENINHHEGFRVGEVETTSCIQGFTLPGLTWVDSPGLHSVTEANGELAREYIKSADLVVYLMNFSSASRESDLQELSELLKAGKRILVLLTRCDSTAKDECPTTGEIIDQKVMRSAKDRQDAQEYSLQKINELREKLGVTEVDVSVLTLSVEFASANHNTPQALEESGVAALFKQLEQLLHGEGIALKKQVPTNNLREFYNSLLAPDSPISIHQLSAPLNEAIANVHEQRAEIAKLSERTQSSLELSYAQQVNALVEKHAANRNVEALQKEIARHIQQSLVEQYQKPLSELLEASFSALTDAIGNQHIEGLEFTDQHQQISVDVSGKGMAIGGGLGAVIGSGVGFLLGGPVGMLIGGAVGGTAGGGIGSAVSGTELRNVLVGDNREDVKEVLLAYGQKLIREQLHHIQTEVNNTLLQPLLNTLNGLNNNTQELAHYIEVQTNV